MGDGHGVKVLPITDADRYAEDNLLHVKCVNCGNRVQGGEETVEALFEENRCGDGGFHDPE